MTAKISEIINEIKKNVLETEQEEAVHGSHFNIFSILQIEKKEVETHSTFIYELLSPHGSHRKKDLFLKLFIENVLKLTDYGEIIRVSREDPTTANRRIDFVIETKKFIIGVEMKIDAGDQYKQLSDYNEELKKRKNHAQDSKLFYLTKFGDYASDDSKKNLIAGTDYYTLSFRDDIDEWIDQCILAVSNQQTLREGLVQYKNLIHKITDKRNKKMEDSLHEMVNSVNDIKAIDSISKSYPLLWAKKEIDFWQTVKRKFLKSINKNEYYIVFKGKVKKEDETLCPSILSNARVGYSKARVPFGFYIRRPLDIKNYIVEVEVVYDQKKHKIVIDFVILNINTENPRTNAQIRKIQEEMKMNISSKVRFYTLQETQLTYELFDEKEFDTLTTGLSKEIISFIEHLESHYENITNILNK